MIVLTKNNETIEIPNYDDLENKPKINGVTLEGNKTSAELGIDLDIDNFYNKIESDERFQKHVPTIIIKEETGELIGDDIQVIMAAFNNNTPFNAILYLKTTNGERILFAESCDYSDGSFTIDFHYCNGTTNSDYRTFNHMNYVAYWKLFPNSMRPPEFDGLLYDFHAYQPFLESGYNIKTINGNSILGSGDLEITPDLSNYYTKSEIDTQISNINTILENIQKML